MCIYASISGIFKHYIFALQNIPMFSKRQVPLRTMNSENNLKMMFSEFVAAEKTERALLRIRVFLFFSFFFFFFFFFFVCLFPLCSILEIGLLHAHK